MLLGEGAAISRQMQILFSQEPNPFNLDNHTSSMESIINRSNMVNFMVDNTLNTASKITANTTKATARSSHISNNNLCHKDHL